MNEFLNFILYNKKELFIIKIILIPLFILSLIYSFIVFIKFNLYKYGLFKTHDSSCNVISVGNLTLGGTGKTPVTIYIADLLIKMNIKTGIVSRGYKSDLKNKHIIIDENNIKNLTAMQTGDEPLMIANRLKKVPVFCGKKRVNLCQVAYNEYHCNTVILDDGFQYLKLKKDINIVLLDAQNPLGNKHIFPRGPLREPVSQLKNADIIWVNNSAKTDILSQEITNKFKNKTIVSSKYEIADLINLSSKQSEKIENFKNSNSILVAAIARPDNLITFLKENNIKVKNHILFNDHHFYNNIDYLKINSKIKKFKASHLLITEKDSIKINIAKIDIPCIMIKINVKILNNKEGLLSMINKIR